MKQSFVNEILVMHAKILLSFSSRSGKDFEVALKEPHVNRFK